MFSLTNFYVPIGVLAGLFSLCGYIPYALSVIRGENKPERAAWLIWTLSSALVLLSYYSLGAKATVWVPFSYVLGTATITVLSFIYGKDGWGNLEKITLVVAIVSATRWVLFDNVTTALFLNLLLSFFSYISYIKHLAKHIPKGQLQNTLGWSFYTIGAALNLLAIDSFDINLASLPVVYFVMNSITLFFIIRFNIQDKKIKTS